MWMKQMKEAYTEQKFRENTPVPRDENEEWDEEIRQIVQGNKHNHNRGYDS